MSASNGHNRKQIYLETFGCQMNELDSELVRSHLGALGYQFTPTPDHADIILYNTCSVREQAENKVKSRVGRVGIEKKRNNRNVILGVLGCMAEREGAAMMRHFPQIDLMCGPGELDKLPMLIDNVMKTDAVELADRMALQGNNARRSATLHAAEDNLEMLDLSRAFDPDRAEAGGRSAYVRITRGCNKFCTYCVVPHTRGPEVHRPPQTIIDECKRLAEHGVIEVTLLGQTVNHYIYTHGTAVNTNGAEVPQIGPGAEAFKRQATTQATNGRNGNHRNTLASSPPSRKTTTFADLLHRIHEEVPEIKRLRFVTSFPRDFGDDILQVMADSPRICRYLHVPAQSGSNAVLKRMNRGYTREQYLEFVQRVRTYLPDAEIAGDIIVGFPGETDDDFEQTKSLLREVRFKNNFIFKYSPRPGTVAIKRFEDDVPDDVKRRRNNELLALQAQISEEVHAAYIGRTVDVFVEKVTGYSPLPARGRGAGGEGPSRDRQGAVSLTVSGVPRVDRAAATRAIAQQTPTPRVPRVDSPQANNPCDHTTHAGTACPDGTSRGTPRKMAARDEPTPAVQLSGRTAGDLITVFDLPAGLSADLSAEQAPSSPDSPDALIGRIVPIRITGARPLLLHGEYAHAPAPHRTA